MKLAIITINFNGAPETIKLLESLQSAENNANVFVVDNNSQSEDAGILENYFQSALKSDQISKLIKNKVNLGFSGGNNVAAETAVSNNADWVLLLNNDTTVENSFIARLKTILEQSEYQNPSIIGIPLNEGKRTAYAGRINWLKPTLRHVYQPLSMFDNKTAYAIGAAMLVHGKVFETVGFLDEKYFLYFEDADFCQRAKAAGFEIKFLPDLGLNHRVSASTAKLGSPVLLRYHYRNALYFNVKNGPWYIKIAVWPWSWLIITKQILKLLISRRSAQSHAILSGVMDFYLGRFGKITLD